MAFPYKHVLLVGGTSGIGRAMADRLIQAGIKVTAVGRREQRLDEFIAKHGEEKASAMNYDVSDIDGAAQFATEYRLCLSQSGHSTEIQVTDPKDGDLSDFRAEMDVNFISYVALTQAFIPFLMSKSTPTSFIFTTSLLALVPAPRIPAYSAAKAALNAFLYCLRDQLRESNVKVIELAPPLVSTELHDYMGIEKGRSMGMPVDQYAEDAYKVLEMGIDEILGGSAEPKDVFQDLADKRRKVFDDFAPMFRDVD